MNYDKRLVSYAVYIAILAVIIGYALGYANVGLSQGSGIQKISGGLSFAQSSQTQGEPAYAIFTMSTEKLLSDPIMTTYCDFCGELYPCNGYCKVLPNRCPHGGVEEECIAFHTTTTSTIRTTTSTIFTTTSTTSTSSSTTSTTSTSTTSTTSSTTTSTTSTSTAYYSCDTCVNPTTGFSCPTDCSYQTTGPSNGCPSNMIACTPTPTPPPLRCGLLPPSLEQTIQSTEPWYCPINESIYFSWQGYIPIAIIVVLIAFLIAGGIFMVGAATKNSRIRNFGVGELYEAIASAIIVVLFLYISAVVFGLVPGVFVGAINPYATALHLITTTINSAENVYNELFRTYFYDMYLSSIKATISTPAYPAANITNEIVPLAFLGLDIFYIEPTAVITSFIADGILALYAEYYLIVFFAVAAIPVFLVPGVILRAILPTRSLGGILIATAAGFYFVMPLLFAVAFYFTAPHLITQLNAESALLARYGAGRGAELNALTSTSPLVTNLSSIESTINSFWLLILFYPALISAVTYAFIVQLANFIGGTARMSGRLRAGFI